METHLQKPPIAHAVSSETINALGFLSVTPASHHSMLLVASSTKSIRLYDLRSPGLNSDNERGPRSSLSTSHPIVSQVLNPNGQWISRSVVGFKSDPFDPHRFASWYGLGSLYLSIRFNLLAINASLSFALVRTCDSLSKVLLAFVLVLLGEMTAV